MVEILLDFDQVHAPGLHLNAVIQEDRTRDSTGTHELQDTLNVAEGGPGATSAQSPLEVTELQHGTQSHVCYDREKLIQSAQQNEKETASSTVGSKSYHRVQ